MAEITLSEIRFKEMVSQNKKYAELRAKHQEELNSISSNPDYSERKKQELRVELTNQFYADKAGEYEKAKEQFDKLTDELSKKPMLTDESAQKASILVDIVRTLGDDFNGQVAREVIESSRGNPLAQKLLKAECKKHGRNTEAESIDNLIIEDVSAECRGIKDILIRAYSDKGNMNILNSRLSTLAYKLNIPIEIEHIETEKENPNYTTMGIF